MKRSRPHKQRVASEEWKAGISRYSFSSPLPVFLSTPTLYSESTTISCNKRLQVLALTESKMILSPFVYNTFNKLKIEIERNIMQFNISSSAVVFKHSDSLPTPSPLMFCTTIVVSFPFFLISQDKRTRTFF